MRGRLATLAMGARFELVLEGRDRAHARAAGEAALEEIERCDARWSLFHSASLIARVNREADARAVELDHDTFELLAACLELRERTLGAFDVALGARMAALGFRGASADDRLPQAGAFELDARTRTVRFTRAGTQLDLGAIGKGEALDRAAQVLREAGIERALLHGGTSSVLALARPGDGAWRVALAGFDGEQLELEHRALSVSATHSRVARAAGVERGHLLDPLTGASLAARARACVLGPSARECEAWSTASLVLLARALDPRALIPAPFELRLRAQAHDALLAQAAPTR